MRVVSRMDNCQYATIDEIKKFSPALKHKILHAEQAGRDKMGTTITAPSTTLQLEYLQQEEQPPPLPPLPPPKNSNHRHSQLEQKTSSPPLLRGKEHGSPRATPPMQKASSLDRGDEKQSEEQSTKAASEGNVSSSRDEEVRADSLMHTSLSSPTLSAMATPPLENGSMSTTPPHSPDQTDGLGSKKKPPVYATINKPISPPPPLPPPLAPEDLPRDNPEESCLILAPQHGNESDGSKPRRPVPLPRAHVYETVPTDFAAAMQPPQPQSQPQGKPHGQPPAQSHVVEQYSSPSLFKSSLRRSNKKKRISKSEKKGTGKITMDDRPCPPPLTSLADLEPLPTNRQAMKLSEFVRLYGHYLPLRVNVEEGYCGTEERFVISSGDVYNFHFVKNEKIVSIRDCGGSSFSIPLNSAIQFGLLYNPGNNFKTALQGHVFKTVSELATSKHALPRILCATRSHLANDSKSSVLCDELLVVRKMGRTTVMRKPFLKALSLKTNEEKTLQEDCEGHFSTNPDLLKLYLPEVLEHFSQSLPLESMLYIKQDTSDDLPLHLTTDMVTVSHTAIESSIIASTCWEYEKQEVELSEEDRALVAIPTDLDIEVTFLGREAEDEKLYESTRDYFEKFSTLKIKDMKNSGGMQRGKGSTLTQTKLYKNVREGFEPKGTEIKMPYRLSGVFEGELSPRSRSMSNKFPVMLENGEEEGVVSSAVSPTQSPKKAPNKKDRNSLVSPHHTPSHTPNHTPHHTSNHTPNPLTSAPADATSTNSPTTPLFDILKTQDSDLESLEKLYSDIDDIFEVTMQNADSVVPPEAPPVDPRTCAKPTKEQKVANPIYVPSMRASLAEPLLQAPPPPKPMPRTRSQTEIAALAKQQQQAGGGEVVGQEVVGGASTLTYEELFKHYSQLQVEMQHLKKELENARELEAGYEVVPSHTDHHHPPAAVRLRSAQPSTTYMQRPLSIIKANSIQDQKKNKEYLRNLDHLEVICLLESMNLGQYRDNFMAEQVDGEILAECDENTLEKELHIASTLHRSRLMKVITGRHSALSFLQAGDVYSTLDHR